MKGEIDMDKPISVIREETKQNIAKIINSSGLPAFVIEPILVDFLNEVRMIAQRQYEMEKMQYEQSLKLEEASLDKEADSERED